MGPRGVLGGWSLSRGRGTPGERGQVHSTTTCAGSPSHAAYEWKEREIICIERMTSDCRENVRLLWIKTNMEVPELEHLGVNLCSPPLDMRPAKLLQALVGIGGEGFQLAIWRDEIRRLSSEFKVQGAGFRVQGSGFKVQTSGFRVQGSGVRVRGPGSRVQGSGFRVQGSGSGVQGSGFRAQGSGLRG